MFVDVSTVLDLDRSKSRTVEVREDFIGGGALEVMSLLMSEVTFSGDLNASQPWGRGQWQSGFISDVCFDSIVCVKRKKKVND